MSGWSSGTEVPRAVRHVWYQHVVAELPHPARAWVVLWRAQQLHHARSWHHSLGAIWQLMVDNLLRVSVGVCHELGKQLDPCDAQLGAQVVDLAGLGAGSAWPNGYGR